MASEPGRISAEERASPAEVDDPTEIDNLMLMALRGESKRGQIHKMIEALLHSGRDPSYAEPELEGVNVIHAIILARWSSRAIIKLLFAIMESYSRHPQYDITGLLNPSKDVGFEDLIRGHLPDATHLTDMLHLIGMSPKQHTTVRPTPRQALYMFFVNHHGLPPSPFLAAVCFGPAFRDDSTSETEYVPIPRKIETLLAWPNVLGRAARATVIPIGTLSCLFKWLRMNSKFRTPHLRTYIHAALHNKYPVWTPSTYTRYSTAHRLSVRTIMLVARRMACRMASECHSQIFWLPNEMWFAVIGFLPVESVPPVAWCMTPLHP